MDFETLFEIYFVIVRGMFVQKIQTVYKCLNKKNDVRITLFADKKNSDASYSIADKWYYDFLSILLFLVGKVETFNIAYIIPDCVTDTTPARLLPVTRATCFG